MYITPLCVDRPLYNIILHHGDFGDVAKNAKWLFSPHLGGVFATSKSPSLSFSFVVILSLLDCCLDGVVLISNDGFKLCLCCSPFPDGGVSSARTILLGEKLVLLFLVGESFNSSLSPLAIFFNGDDDKKVAAAVLTRVGDFPLGE